MRQLFRMAVAAGALVAGLCTLSSAAGAQGYPPPPIVTSPTVVTSPITSTATSPTTATAVKTSPSSTSAPIAFTGADIAGMVIGGLGLIAIGTLMVSVFRRRNAAALQ